MVNIFCLEDKIIGFLDVLVGDLIKGGLDVGNLKTQYGSRLNNDLIDQYNAIIEKRDNSSAFSERAEWATHLAAIKIILEERGAI